MIDLIDACPHKWTYRAGVVSFAREDAPTEDQQQEVIDRFEEIAFAGLDADRYARLHDRVAQVAALMGRGLERLDAGIRATQRQYGARA